MIAVNGFDHLVLTVSDLDRTIRFYVDVLGMEARRFGPQGRQALHFGDHKINLHLAGHEFEPKARSPQPGSADLCLRLPGLPDRTLAHLHALGVDVEEGPVPRTGATGPITSVYLRDPDGNLIELAHSSAG